MLLIRHAQSAWNLVFGATRVDAAIVDPDLTPEGIASCEAAAAKLAKEELTRIVASPYRRTLHTATLLGRALDLPISVDARVRERCAFSCDQGTPRSRLTPHWPTIEFGQLEERWWGNTIESAVSLQHRAASFLATAGRWPDQATVLVVTHWGLIRCVTGLEVGNLATARLDPARSAATIN